VLSPSDFVAIANQTLEYAFGLASIEGELSNFRISKNKWVYFDVKDELAKVSCFASVYALPGPLEDGMMVKIIGQPRLHPQFGFSVTVQTIQPSGEGSLKKAFELLKAKLTAEGLFEESRKRYLPHPPNRIALVTSIESAAYADFIKIISARWPFVLIDIYDVQVQGEPAPAQLASAIAAANNNADLADVLIVTRGGGSADDLAAFNDERVVRAVAASRIPTLVAIGHEIDESLAELAADKRASTPSNAAELLVPDRKSELAAVVQLKVQLQTVLKQAVSTERQNIGYLKASLARQVMNALTDARHDIATTRSLLQAYNPQHVLRRGYALMRSKDALVRSVSQLTVGDIVEVQVNDGLINANVIKVKPNNKEQNYA
jgi:exodeoxyribonuclease VII large subunit